MQIQYINNLRAVACYLVILVHSAMPALDPKFGIFMVFFSILGSPSSELFVMISSSLLAPTKLDMFSFYGKRFSKLLGPFLFWSACVLAIDLLQGEINFNGFINNLILFPIKPVQPTYWFVYSICGLYLIIPLISPWLSKCKKKELLFVIAIWIITLLLPYLNLIFNSTIYELSGNYYFFLVYSGGFIGYLFLGVFLRKYPILFANKFKGALFILSIFLLASLPLFYGYLYNRDILIIVKDNLSINSALFVVAIFIYFQNFKMPTFVEYLFNIIAKYSFGIYLVHVIVVFDIIRPFIENNRISHPLIETPLISIISILMCYSIVRIISYLPKSKYIIGV